MQHFLGASLAKFNGSLPFGIQPVFVRLSHLCHRWFFFFFPCSHCCKTCRGYRNKELLIFNSFTREMSALSFPLEKNTHIYDIFSLLSISCDVVMPETSEDFIFGDYMSSWCNVTTMTIMALIEVPVRLTLLYSCMVSSALLPSVC